MKTPSSTPSTTTQKLDNQFLRAIRIKPEGRLSVPAAVIERLQKAGSL